MQKRTNTHCGYIIFFLSTSCMCMQHSCRTVSFQFVYVWHSVLLLHAEKKTLNRKQRKMYVSNIVCVGYYSKSSYFMQRTQPLSLSPFKFLVPLHPLHMNIVYEYIAFAVQKYILSFADSTQGIISSSPLLRFFYFRLASFCFVLIYIF